MSFKQLTSPTGYLVFIWFFFVLQLCSTERLTYYLQIKNVSVFCFCFINMNWVHYWDLQLWIEFNWPERFLHFSILFLCAVVNDCIIIYIGQNDEPKKNAREIHDFITFCMCIFLYSFYCASCSTLQADWWQILSSAFCFVCCYTLGAQPKRQFFFILRNDFRVFCMLSKVAKI